MSDEHKSDYHWVTDGCARFTCTCGWDATVATFLEGVDAFGDHCAAAERAVWVARIEAARVAAAEFQAYDPAEWNDPDTYEAARSAALDALLTSVASVVSEEPAP